MNNSPLSPINPPLELSRRSLLGLGASAALTMLLGPNLLAADGKRRVVCWSECTAPADPYPNDINGAVAEALKPLTDCEILTANLDQPDQGLPDELLNKTDVLVWWGHKKHGKVNDDLVKKIVKRVKEDGMGFLALHSAHYAKAYKALMLEITDPNDAEMRKRIGSWGAYTCDSTVIVSAKDADHPICKGVAKSFDLGQTERYSEKFIVPNPEAVPFECEYTHSKDGNTITEKARQCLCWTVGKGKVFYMQTGHETYKHFFDPNIMQILRNAVEWAAPKK